jgi:hypothetical protein
MFLVGLTRYQEHSYAPLTISAPEYIYHRIEFIARSTADAAARARRGVTQEDAVPRYSAAFGEDDVELF